MSLSVTQIQIVPIRTHNFAEFAECLASARQFVFESHDNAFHFAKNYYEENGTKYLKNSRPLPVSILEDLLQCAGEIYLSGIPGNVTAERIASVACLLGEMYLLRFKVNFAGLSRGFAYMQYVNPGLMNLAIQRLPELFRLSGLTQIRVKQSKNCSKLLLRNVFTMTPEAVEQTLMKMVHFRQINARRLHGDKFEYQIVFGSNDDAVRARRIIISNIYSFGQSAMVVWDRVYSK